MAALSALADIRDQQSGETKRCGFAVGDLSGATIIPLQESVAGNSLVGYQMMDFPVGDHDDGPDALEMALRMMIELWNKNVEQSMRRVTRLRP